MMYQSEKLYMYNPFNLKNWKNEQIKEQLDVLIERYDCEADTMMGLALNAENLTNQLTLIGEMIARLTEEVNLLDADIKKELSIEIYISRIEWVKNNGSGKAPSIDYFKALAQQKVSDKANTLAKKESDLKRFKIAYESMQEKINAIKRKMDAVKFESVG